MVRSPRPLLAFALLGASAACAHAPAARRALTEVTWPEPPAPPRVRLVSVFPDPEAPAPRRSVWRAFLDVVAGTERTGRPEAWLQRPFGLAVDAGGTYYVADPDAAAVLRVDPAGGAGRIRCKRHEWAAPMALALTAEGALFVADAGAAAVVRVGRDGSCRALGSGALERPTGLALDGERLFVVDPPRHQVTVLAASGGEVLGHLGSLGEAEGELHFPTAIARAPDGTLLVVDALNFRIVRFAPDGRWLGAFGSAGDVGAGFERPKAVVTDSAGWIYVSDAQRGLVLVHRPDGTFDYAIGAQGSGPGELSLPAGLAVAAGRLYVADSHNRRIQVFEILGGSS